MVPCNSDPSSRLIASSPGCRSTGVCRPADGGAEAGGGEAGSVWNAVSDAAGVCGDACGVSTERTLHSRSLHRGLMRCLKASFAFIFVSPSVSLLPKSQLSRDTNQLAFASFSFSFGQPARSKAVSGNQPADILKRRNGNPREIHPSKCLFWPLVSVRTLNQMFSTTAPSSQHNQKGSHTRWRPPTHM